MKIKVQRSRLLDGIKKVQGLSNAKSLPILGNVLMEAVDGELHLTTSNLDNTLYAVLDGVEVDEGGGTTLPFALLQRCVSALPDGEVSIDVDPSDTGRVSCGNVRFRIVGMPAANFPKLPEETGVTFKVPVPTLSDLLRKTAYAQSADQTRRTLQSILFDFSSGESLVCVGTDGRRLSKAVGALSEKTEAGNYTFIVPSMAVGVIQKAATGEGDAVFSFTASQLVLALDGGKLKLYSRLLDGVYPEYKRVIPSTKASTAVVDRELVVAAVNRALVMTNGEGGARFTFNNGKLTVEAKGDNDNGAKDELPVKFDGEKVDIVFNPSYVLSPLTATSSDAVTIDFVNGESPAVFSAEGEDWVHVLMPLRTS